MSRGQRYLRPDRKLPGKGGPIVVARPAGWATPMGWHAIVLLLISTVLLPTRLEAAVDAASVQRAIDRGIAHLRKTQNQRGGWTEFSGQSCGLSSLCTLALLTAGVPRDDPDMIRAMRYLRGFEPNETYSVSLQTLVYCQLGAAGDLPRIRRNVDWLIANQRSGDPVSGHGGS